MPSEYSKNIFYYDEKCDLFDSNKNLYLINKDIKYCPIDRNTKQKKKKVICDDKFFQIDTNKFNSIVKK